MKLIVAGSREFKDYELLRKKLDHFLQNVVGGVSIVSGTANGADKLGERYAKERCFKVKEFPADWNKYKKQAGYFRNKQMAEYATHAVIFWDGRSRGSKMMIDLCKEYGLKYRVVRYDLQTKK